MKRITIAKTSDRGLMVYINGEFYASSEAKISVFDHGLLYGDGVFEGICIYQGRIFKLAEHVRRLYASAKTIDLHIPLSQDEFAAIIIETVKRNRLRDGYVRPVVTRGVGKMGLDPRNCSTPTIIIIPQTAEMYPNLTAGQKVAKAIVSTIRRTPSYCLPAAAKTLNYLNNILAKLQAIHAGVDEGIMLDLMGFVSEGTGDNLFIVRHGKLITPPLHTSILEGITRRTILEIAESLRLPAGECELTLHDLYNAEESFLVSTSLEVQPLTEIDGRIIGNGKVGHITKRIQHRFNEIKKSEGTLAIK